MKPGESFRTDEFVSGQNLHSGSWNYLRVIPAWLESAHGFSSCTLEAFYCINMYAQGVLRYSVSVGNVAFWNKNSGQKENHWLVEVWVLTGLDYKVG